MRLASAILSFGIAFIPITAQAKEKSPIALARSGAWTMNYDDNACNLLAQFGTGQQQIDIRITRTAPKDGFDLMLAGQDLKSANSRASVTITFRSEKPVQIEQTALLGTSGHEKTPMAQLIGVRFDGAYGTGFEPLPPVPAAVEAGIKSIVFKFGRKKFELMTGSMGPPMAAMRTCMNDLVRHWGYDPEVQAKLQRPPTPLTNPGTWLSSSDYPSDSRRQSGIVKFRLDVSESGQVTGCKILQKTDPDSFADITCELIKKRGKFTAALDSEGKPTRSFFASGVRWMASAN